MSNGLTFECWVYYTGDYKKDSYILENKGVFELEMRREKLRYRLRRENG